jgi:hypothetical protein
MSLYAYASETCYKSYACRLRSALIVQHLPEQSKSRELPVGSDADTASKSVSVSLTFDSDRVHSHDLAHETFHRLLLFSRRSQ